MLWNVHHEKRLSVKNLFQGAGGRRMDNDVVAMTPIACIYLPRLRTVGQKTEGIELNGY